jgi:DHA2 family multidrug resistance protein
LIDRQLSQQSALLSFIDDFRYLAVVCALCVPVVFLLKKTKAKKGAVSAAH